MDIIKEQIEKFDECWDNFSIDRDNDDEKYYDKKCIVDDLVIVNQSKEFDCKILCKKMETFFKVIFLHYKAVNMYKTGSINDTRFGNTTNLSFIDKNNNQHLCVITFLTDEEYEKYYESRILDLKEDVFLWSDTGVFTSND